MRAHDGIDQIGHLFFVGRHVGLSFHVFGVARKGFFAALASTLLVISGLTFILLSFNVRGQPTVSFAKHLTWLFSAWFVYVFVMLFSVPRLGFWVAFAGAMILYGLVVSVTTIILR